MTTGAHVSIQFGTSYNGFKSNESKFDKAVESCCAELCRGVIGVTILGTSMAVGAIALLILATSAVFAACAFIVTASVLATTGGFVFLAAAVGAAFAAALLHDS